MAPERQQLRNSEHRHTETEKHHSHKGQENGTNTHFDSITWMIVMRGHVKNSTFR